MIKKADADIAAAAGMVSIHAPTIWRAIPHLTAESFSVAPTPIIEEDITCVVLTGMPMAAMLASTRPLDVSALKPWYGRRRVILCAIVLTIRHPPKKVPRPIAPAQEIITHSGMGSPPPSGADMLVATRRIAIIPMVFCASFVPWVSEKKAEEKS